MTHTYVYERDQFFIAKECISISLIVLIELTLYSVKGLDISLTHQVDILMALINIGIAINDMSFQDNKSICYCCQSFTLCQFKGFPKGMFIDLALIKQQKPFLCSRAKVGLPMFEKPYGNIHIECMWITFILRLLS